MLDIEDKDFLEKQQTALLREVTSRMEYMMGSKTVLEQENQMLQQQVSELKKMMEKLEKELDFYKASANLAQGKYESNESLFDESRSPINIVRDAAMHENLERQFADESRLQPFGTDEEKGLPGNVIR